MKIRINFIDKYDFFFLSDKKKSDEFSYREQNIKGLLQCCYNCKEGKVKKQKLYNYNFVGS